MQLGGRFSPGDAPRSLPPEIRAQIESVEAELPPEQRSTLRWTLTWLEGRPVLELDNGVVIGGANPHQL